MNLKDRMNWKWALGVVGLLIMLVLFASMLGKKDQFKDFHDYIVQLKQEGANKYKNATIPSLQVPVQVTKVMNVLRSPFESSSSVTTTSRSTPANSPLQAFSLSVLQFVGTITKDGAISAYIMAPDNMMYHVSVGDWIGDRGGKVSDIQPGRLNVTEPTGLKDKNGTQRIVTLQLKEAR